MHAQYITATDDVFLLCQSCAWGGNVASCHVAILIQPSKQVQTVVDKDTDYWTDHHAAESVLVLYKGLSSHLGHGVGPSPSVGRGRLAVILYSVGPAAVAAVICRVGLPSTRSTGSIATSRPPSIFSAPPRHWPDIGNHLDHPSRANLATQRRYWIRPTSPTASQRRATSRPVPCCLQYGPRGWPLAPVPHGASPTAADRRRGAFVPRRTGFVPTTGGVCPQEGGRSRRSNFLAALNVLRVCGRPQQPHTQNGRAARFSPATKLNFQENISGRIDQMSEHGNRQSNEYGYAVQSRPSYRSRVLNASFFIQQTRCEFISIKAADIIENRTKNTSKWCAIDIHNATSHVYFCR